MDESTQAAPVTEVGDKAKTRGTITLTHKQAGATGLSISTFFLILHFLNSNYASKSDAVAIKSQVSEVKEMLRSGLADQKNLYATHLEDETTTHRRMMDITRTELASEKTDRQAGDETVSKRIDLVMELFKIKHTKPN